MSRPPTTPTTVPTLVRFRTNLDMFLELIRELIGCCYDAGNQQVNPEWIGKVKMFLHPFSSDELIETFIDYSFITEANGKIECIWDKIFQRDEKYISQHANFLFRNLRMISEDKISAFKVLFESRDRSGNFVINTSDREAVWKYLNSTVKITLVYIHEQRHPKLKRNDDGTTKGVYTRDYRRNIDLKRYLQNYPDLELRWE